MFEDIDIIKSIPSDTEIEIYRDSLKVLLGGIMTEKIPGFQWLSMVIIYYIPHLYQKEMAKRSTTHSLSLSFHNVCSYELEGLFVPLGLDQLTRVIFLRS